MPEHLGHNVFSLFLFDFSSADKELAYITGVPSSILKRIDSLSETPLLII